MHDGGPVPGLDLPAQHAPIRDEILAAVGELLASGRFVLGEAVERFESEAADWLGVGEAIGVGSGTDALWLVLAGLGVGPGDEVITPAYSFFAVAEAIERAGATPVFIDVDDETLCVTAEAVVAAITDRTRAIVPVHLYGLPAPIDAIRDAIGGREIPIVEDAAQAFGAAAGDRKVGALGDVAAFSFYPTKNLGACGDGGLVTTSLPEIAREIRILRDHGQTGKYQHERFGWNSRLDAIQAAILSIKLPHVRRWNETRREHASCYSRLLSGLPLRLPVEPPGYFHVYHQYTIRSERRNRLREFLAEARIDTAVHYPAPLHEQGVYENRPGPLPVAEQAAREVLCLPIHPELPEGAIDRVGAAIREFLENEGAAAGPGVSERDRTK